MGDMISRSRLLDSIHREDTRLIGGNHYVRLSAVQEKIRIAPTVDAVEVVRCRECIHRVRTKSNLGFSWCGKFGNVMRDADFCLWGEQKMGGGANDEKS